MGVLNCELRKSRIWDRKNFKTNIVIGVIAALGSFVDRVEIFPERKPTDQLLKHIDFCFPVYFNGQQVNMWNWNDEITPETVVQLSKGEIESTSVKFDVSLEDADLFDFQQGATYNQIIDYVQQTYDMNVSTLCIAQVKEKCGIKERENYNKPKHEDAIQPQCPPEKEAAILNAFRHFQMI